MATAKRSATTGSSGTYGLLLQVFSCLAVLTLTVTSLWLYDSSLSSGQWQIVALWDALSRWGIPVLVMCAGMELLAREKVGLLNLCLHHILRMLVVILFWGVVYGLVEQLLSGDFSWFTIPALVYSVLLGQVPEHFWVLYLLLGLYLLSPVLCGFLRGASRGELHWFFGLWFLFVSLIPLVLRLYGGDLLDWYTTQLYLNFVSDCPPLGYVGYFVAGYYLKKYTLGRIAELLVYLCALVGAVVTVWGSLSGMGWLFLGYLTPNVCACAVGVFVLFRYLLGISDERSRRQKVGRTAQYTFGIYLVHVLFLMLYQHFGLTGLDLTPLLMIPLLTVALWVPSLAVVWVMRKVPFVGKYLT